MRFFGYLIVIASVVYLLGCASQENKPLNLSLIDTQRVEVEQDSSLMSAARSGNVPAIRLALAQGDKLNALSPRGTAFSMALTAKQYAVAKFLLNIGADPSIGFDTGERSALMIAAAEGKNALVEALLSRGIDVNYRDWREHSALSLATIAGHLTTMKILISDGADVNIDAEGRSLLQHAVADNNSLLAQLLIRAGADVNYRNSAGETALRIARRGGFFDLDLMLVQAGAN